MRVECTTQSELDSISRLGQVAIISGYRHFCVTSECQIECIGGAPHIVVFQSTEAHILVLNDARPEITNEASQNVYIKVRDQAQPHIKTKHSSKTSIVAEAFARPSIEAMHEANVSIEVKNLSAPQIESGNYAQTKILIRDSATPYILARGTAYTRIRALDVSCPIIEVEESTQTHIEVRQAALPKVTASGAAQVHLVSLEDSQSSILATAYCQLRVQGNISVRAAPTVSITTLNESAKIDGGNVGMVDLGVPMTWCEYYGVPIEGDSVVLFKALDNEYKTNYTGFPYVPGTTPIAPDWDGGEDECGKGLHFSPSPRHARDFFPSAKRFCACRVLLAEMVTHPNGKYPQKVKAPRALEVWEVTL